MTTGTDWGASVRRHDWKSPLRDQAKAVATRLRLHHHGIWAMDGSIENVEVSVTERVHAHSVTLSISVTTRHAFGPEGLRAIHQGAGIPRLVQWARRQGIVVGRGRSAIRVVATDADQLRSWLTDERREALEALGRVDGKLLLDGTGLRLRSNTIGKDATQVERTIQSMVTAVVRFSS